jgi:predicted O-linked N-acetylglucosamine transferase (SPINDLY family)
VPPAATTDVRALLERGLAAQQAGRLAEAEAAYREVLDHERANPDALHLLGVVMARRGDARSAAELICRAIAARPNMPMFHNNLGNALADTNALEAAAEAYGRAVQLAPNYAEALANLGAVLAKLNDAAGAEAACRRALALVPHHRRALNTLGTLLLGRGKYDGAESCFRKILDSDPNDVHALIGVGAILRDKARLDDARSYLRRALAIEPDSIGARGLLGSILVELNELDDANAVLERAVELDPKDATALFTLARAKASLADFSLIARLQDQALAVRPDDTLIWRHKLSTVVYEPTADAAARAAVHRAFAQAMRRRARKPLSPPTNDPNPERRLRVGWLSSDFRYGHPVARNLAPLFGHRDRSRFEFICYTERAPTGDATVWSSSSADAWRHVAGLSDEAVAAQIRTDRIDIMVYLAGRFDHNRPQVAVWRPAPVQVSLYDAATSGLEAMDYFIADPVMVPRSTSEWFSERVVRLPSYYIHEPVTGAAEPGAPPLLAGGCATFGSFNSPAKLNDQVLALWAEVLRRIPSARLRLKYRTAFASKLLQDRVRRALGADASARLDFETVPQNIGEHLQAYHAIDISLDPFPFTGATTTFEALWMGVPVVTLLGDTFMGRWSASMLHALKLDDLIARTPEEYVECAVRLAGDPPLLAALRAGLRERLSRSPLCNGPLRARQMQRLLRALWRRWCRTPA